MLFTSLTIPRWLRDGIQPNEKGASMRKFIWGGDTETLNGAPMTFQFYANQPQRAQLLWVDDPDDASTVLFRWIKSLPANSEHVVYVHNLEFDLVSFLWDCKSELVSSPDGEFRFTRNGWRVEGVYGAPTYARVVDPHRKRRVLFVDSYSYYRASLAAASEVFCPHLPKLKRPDGLGTKRFSKRDEEFAAYALRDAEIACFIGEALEKLHDEFDLTQTVSVADMAARIFRHQFLDRTIPQPPRPIIEAALLAYHGGKNNMPVTPGWYLGVSSLDISSAYPHAMTTFPSFSVASAYRRFRGSRVQSVPELGVYRIAGKVAPCPWPSLYAHDFTALSGAVEGVWVGGHELNEALESGEFKPTSVEGWYYDADADRFPSPFVSFVAEFYRRKEAEQDKAMRAMYKFVLNSVSGKFIQTRKRQKVTHVDIDSGKVSDSGDLVAGGMFHPFIAQAITGHTRARIHRLEHRYKAIHTATDGIFTQARDVKSEPKGLGALVCEARGDLLLLRNKLYVLYSDDGKQASAVFKGKRVAKAALHGFAGTVADLERLVATNRRRYRATRVNRLRDSLKRGLTPNEFTVRDYVLKVGPLPVHDSC